MFPLTPCDGITSMSAINDVTDLVVESGVAVITIDSPPVNALSFKVRDGLYHGLQAAIADEAVKAIVVMCAGRTFIAGADITEFGGAPKGAACSMCNISWRIHPNR